jgi:hypothetical protein
MLAVGLLLIAMPCCYFYLKELRPIAEGRRQVEKRRELIEAAQDTAVAMTRITQQLRTLAFKHAEEVAQMVQTVRPLARRVGLTGIADSPVIARTDSLAREIVAVTGGITQVLEDVETGLKTSDPRVLRRYLNQLRDISTRMEGLLARS